jgi:hypothetical protein
MPLYRTALRAAAALVVAGGLAGAPAQAAEPLCPPDPVEHLADGSFLYSNQAGDAGCVTAQVFANGAARVYRVTVAPGWTAQVKSSGGTTNGSRVQVEFSNPATKARVSVRMEAGRTVIK